MEAERRERGRLWAQELERRLRPVAAIQEEAPRRRPKYSRVAVHLAALSLGLRRGR